ncbi:MAG TPA: hypothetical protein VJS88_02295 [Chthoniobacterales bacterium]|nr:hypothetical protein [Chthoniobacterales bacterium]
MNGSLQSSKGNAFVTATPRRPINTFFSVLGAGLVLLLVFIQWQRFDRWSQAKHTLVNRISVLESENSGPPGASSGQILSQLASLRDEEDSCQELVALLADKPLFLPLTPTERRLRSHCQE